MIHNSYLLIIIVAHAQTTDKIIQWQCDPYSECIQQTALGWYLLLNIMFAHLYKTRHHDVSVIRKSNDTYQYFLSLIVSMKDKIKLNNDADDWLCETFTKSRKRLIISNGCINTDRYLLMAMTYLRSQLNIMFLFFYK